MITAQNTNKEITLIFNGKDFEDRLVYAELKRIRELGYSLQGIDVSERKLTVEQAEKITRELGEGNPQNVLNEEFLKAYLVAHVNNFNEFSTVGQLLEDATSLKTPIVIRNGLADFLDTSEDYIYEELKTAYDVQERTGKTERASGSPARLLNFNARQLALYFSVLLLVLSVLYQVVNFKNPVKADRLPPSTETSAIVVEDL